VVALQAHLGGDAVTAAHLRMTRLLPSYVPALSSASLREWSVNLLKKSVSALLRKNQGSSVC
jgi:hypothetical protein